MMGYRSERDVLSTVMAMSLIISTCIFDFCSTSVNPEFTSTPNDRPVVGSTLTISCSGSGDIWYMSIKKANSDIAMQDGLTSCDFTSALREGATVPACPFKTWNLTVVIPNVTPDDSADYVCDITMNGFSIPNEKATKTVMVIVPPSKPTVEGKTTVIEGERLDISCGGATAPGAGGYTVTLPVVYKWKKDGLFIQEDSSLNLDRYAVERVTPQNAGMYQCIAENEAGKLESVPTKVEIYYLPNNVNLTTDKQSRLAGTSENFRCQASDANPTPLLRLMRIKGRSTTEIHQQETLSFTKRLALKPVDNEAEFYCEATSAPSIPDKNVQSSRLKYNVTFPPQVTVVMNKATVRENESTTITCNATGGNPAKVDSYVWDFSRSESTCGNVANSYGTPTRLADRSRQLVLGHVQYDSDGLYRCTAANAAGRQSNETRLDVKYAPRLAEVFKMQPQVAGEVGKTAVFSLQFIADPLLGENDVPWSSEKLTIAPPDFQVNRPSPCKVSLRITSVKVDHYGKYNCTLKNSIGEKTWTFTLLKAGPPQTPSGLATADVTARSITLVWTSEFRGGSAQKFSIMYKKADDTWPVQDQVTSIDDPGYKQEVRHRITNLESNTWYTFRIRSTNRHPGNNKSQYTALQAAKTLELPKTEHLKAYRDGDEVAVSWRQPTGTYDGVKIEYCVTGTVQCSNHTVDDINEHKSILRVDRGQTFIYKLHLLANDDVLFTSPAFHAIKAPIRSSSIGFIAGGAGLALILVFCALVFCYCRRAKQQKKKKSEMELHNNRALMGAENPALNNTLTRSFNDLGGVTQQLDVANLRKQGDQLFYVYKSSTYKTNMPGPDVVPNRDHRDQPESDYENTLVAGIPVGQVEPMQRPDKDYENLMVADRKNTQQPHIPVQPIQTVSPEGIVYTKVFYTMPNKSNNNRPQPVQNNNNNPSDHYAQIDVNRSAAQRCVEIPPPQEPPPCQSRTQEPRPQDQGKEVDNARIPSPPRSPILQDDLSLGEHVV